MKKIFVLCICIAVLAIVFVFSGKGKYTKVLQDLNVDDLDKIVIYNADVSVTLDMVLCQDLVQVKMRNFSPF